MVEAVERKFVRLDDDNVSNEQPGLKLSQCITDLAYFVQVAPSLETLKMPSEC